MAGDTNTEVLQGERETSVSAKRSLKQGLSLEQSLIIPWGRQLRYSAVKTINMEAKQQSVILPKCQTVKPQEEGGGVR